MGRIPYEKNQPRTDLAVSPGLLFTRPGSLSLIFSLLSPLQPDIFAHKDHRQHQQHRVELLFFLLAGEKMDHHIGQHARRDALRNGVAEGHGRHGEIGRDDLPPVGGLQRPYAAEHHQTHDHQRRRRGEAGHRQEEGREEEGQGKQCRRHYAGQARLTARRDARGAFGKGGGGGGAQRVGEEHAPNPRQPSAFVQHLALRGHADHAAQGVKHIHKEEGEGNGQKVQGQHPGKVHFHQGRGQTGHRQSGGKVG